MTTAGGSEEEASIKQKIAAMMGSEPVPRGPRIRPMAAGRGILRKSSSVFAIPAADGAYSPDFGRTWSVNDNVYDGSGSVGIGPYRPMLTVCNSVEGAQSFSGAQFAGAIARSGGANG